MLGEGIPDMEGNSLQGCWFGWINNDQLHRNCCVGTVTLSVRITPLNICFDLLIIQLYKHREAVDLGSARDPLF
jgi:hypothetical protein